jgi:hypothetical protein
LKEEIEIDESQNEKFDLIYTEKIKADKYFRKANNGESCHKVYGGFVMEVINNAIKVIRETSGPYA